MSLIKLQEGIDWFLKYSKENQVLIILIFIAFFFYFNHRSTLSESKKKEIEYQLIIKELRLKINILEQKNIQHEKRLNKLTSEIIIFKASDDNLPVPQWVKSNEGKFLWVSKEFEKRYLTPMNLKTSDVIGRYESDFLDEKYSIEFKNQDERVISEGRPITFDNFDFLGRKLTVTKYPYRIGREILGVAGLEYYRHE